MMRGGGFLVDAISADAVFTPEDFTEEHKMIAQTASDFVAREVLPRLNEIESQNWDVTLKLMRKAGELGLLSIDIPEKYGGLGLDKTSSMLAAERLGPVGSFTATMMDHTGIGTLPVVYFGNEAQKQKYLPKFASGELISSYSLTEPNSGSDALSIRTTAALSPDGRHYLLNGSKNFLTNGGIADLSIVFAKIDGERFTAFIVEKSSPGITLGGEEKKMGIKGSSTRSMILENVKVSVENVLGQIGQGHKIAFNILNIGRFKLGAAVIGGAKAVLAHSLKYAKNRRQFGRPISDFGLIKEKLAGMALRIFAGESMVYRTAGLIDGALSAVDQNQPDEVLRGIEEYAVECSIIKVYASEILSHVVDEGVQIFGGYGFMEEYPVARPYRDSRINRIFEGTNEINRLLIAGMLFKRAMKGDLPLLAEAKRLADEMTSPAAGEKELPGFLSGESVAVRQCKKAVLLAAGLAAQKYASRLEEEQEILARLSDMVMEIYAMESAVCRVQKMEAAGKKNLDLYADMVRTFASDSAARLEQSGREILAGLAEGDLLKTYLLSLRKLLKRTPANAIFMRRRISDYFVSREEYALP